MVFTKDLHELLGQKLGRKWWGNQEIMWLNKIYNFKGFFRVSIESLPEEAAAGIPALPYFAAGLPDLYL